MQPDRLLKQLGFSKNESKIYLAALESGLSSAQEIAKIAGLPRTTGYSVLNKLTGRGVVAKSLARGKTRFLADPPGKLISLTRDLQDKIKESMPRLEALYNKSETKPKIIFYEGRDAMQRVYDDTLAEKPAEILEWNTDDYFQFEKFAVDPEYIKKRVALNIKAKRIAGAGSRWENNKRRDASELSETLIAPKEKFWPSVEVNIYNDKVAFLNYAESMSIIIESKPLAEAMRQAYYLSWEGAKINQR